MSTPAKIVRRNRILRTIVSVWFTALTLCAVAWVASRWWSFGYLAYGASPPDGSWTFHLSAGRLVWHRDWPLRSHGEYGPEGPYAIRRSRPNWSWGGHFGSKQDAPGHTAAWAILPLWWVGLPLAAAVCHRYWREKPGLCPQCRYDLRGNTSGICPECGRAIVKQE